MPVSRMIAVAEAHSGRALGCAAAGRLAHRDPFAFSKIRGERELSAQDMRSKKWTWTAEENNRLRAFVTEGVSIVKAAAALKRTTTSVRVQARFVSREGPTMYAAPRELNSAVQRFMPRSHCPPLQGLAV